MFIRKFLIITGVWAVLQAGLLADSLTWSGTNGSLWNVNTTVNWNNSGTADVFLPADSVTFNDAASNGTVTLSGTLGPSTVTVNNGTTAYTLGGTGQIVGAASLLKTGTGVLTISTTNTYSGGTVISAGTLIATSTNALGTSGTVTLGDVNTGANNITLLMSAATSTALIYSRPMVVSNQGSGTVTIGRTGTGSGLVTISAPVALNRDVTFQSSSSGTLALSGSFTGTGNATFTGGGVTSLGNITGTSAGSWSGNAAVTGNTMVVATGTSANLFNTGTSRSLDVAAGSGVAFISGTLKMLTGSGVVGALSGTAMNLNVGNLNTSSTFSGVIGSGSAAGYVMGSTVNLTKIGTGTFTLAGNNNYTGTTRVTQGTLALAGAGSIDSSPVITVASGAILNVSALSSGTFTLGSSQLLQAGRTSGFANDVIGNVASSGTINIAGTGTAGTMTISNNLSLTGGKLVFDLANVTTAGAHVNDLISLGGALALSGTTTIAGNLLNGALVNGTYTLISGGTGISSGGSSNLAWGGSLFRQSVAFDTTTTPGAVLMNVSGSAANLIWSGTNGNNWDNNSTVNWNNGGTADVFFAGDSVTFSDSATNGNVVLSGTLQPSSVTINNATTAYAFGGTGVIAGTGGLLKAGSGTVTISTANTYTGGTVIRAGTVVAANTNALSSGTVTLGDASTGTNNVALLASQTGTSAITVANPLAISSVGSGTVTIGRTGTGSGLVTVSSSLGLSRDVTFLSSSSGTLSLTGAFSGSGNATFTGGGVTSIFAGTAAASTWSGNAFVTGNSMLLVSGTGNTLFNTGTARSLDVAAGSGAALTNGTVKMLTGGGLVSALSGTTSLNLGVGSGNVSSAFGGVIGSGTIAGYASSASVDLTKIGTGTFTLTGSNNYTGATKVTQGTLALAGAGRIDNSSTIAVTSGARLDVSALSSGTFTLGSSQLLQAGRTSGFANDVIGNVASSGTINIAGTGTAGTMTISNNLSLTGGKLVFDLANVTTAGSGVNDLITLGGVLSLSGTTFIAPNLLNGTLTNGTYTLISGGTGLSSGDSSNLAWGGTLYRQSIIFDTTTTPGSVTMNVSGAAASLVWSGTNGNIWNTNSTVNWDNAGTPDVFFGGDAVTFNDAASNGNVVLSGTLVPAFVTVNNATTDYVLSGSGQIAGTSSLLKTGTGTLTISTANTYTGGTVISAGTVIVTNTNALGTSGTIALGNAGTGTNNLALLVSTSTSTATTFARPIVIASQGSGMVTIGRTGTGSGLVTIGSGLALNRDVTFLSSSSGTLSLTGAFSGTGNATFSGGGVTSVASLATTWRGNAAVIGNSMLAVTGTGTNLFSTGTARSLDVAAGSGVGFATGTLRMLTGGGTVGSLSGTTMNLAVGSLNASSTFGGVIGSGTVAGYAMGAAVDVTKIGTGTFTLTGNNNYTGATKVTQGTLALAGAGSISNTPSITVTPGARLDVSALSSGTFTLGSNQTLQAGRTSGFANDVIGNVASSGTINIAGSNTAGTVTISNNLALNSSKLVYDLANTTTAGAHVNDLISVGGALSLSGTTSVVANFLNGGLADGTYTLINGASSLTSGNETNLVWGGPLIRQMITFDTTSTPGAVYMGVSGSAANLLWSGSNGSAWNANSTTNWSSSGTAEQFYAVDKVTFNDAGSTGSVVLSGTLLPASVTVNNSTTAYTLSGSGQVAGSGNLVKSGDGVLTILTANAYTGTTVLSQGTIVVNGDISTSSEVTTSAGTKLGGSGKVSKISGGGVVGPGNSPGILTATSVDPSGGLDFSFQFTQTGSPNYSDATGSGNDVLHLTDATPFTMKLTTDNMITLDFTGIVLADGQVFRGGFFTDAMGTDDSTVFDGVPNFAYLGIDGFTIQFDGFVTSTAAFEGGTVTGRVMQFEVSAIPEPGTWVLLVLGMVMLAIRFRRVKA